jgi:hypothetical protein
LSLKQVSFIMEVYDKVKGFFLFSEGELGALPEIAGKNIRTY